MFPAPPIPILTYRSCIFGGCLWRGRSFLLVISNDWRKFVLPGSSEQSSSSVGFFRLAQGHRRDRQRISKTTGCLPVLNFVG